ncbi:hypothetical protein AOC36_02595 [Erysipelothrix larvae]|uniref:Phosphoserine phosphatase n=1 Tax=Erysipelothrix larvae TaxID=1514105 RepID=A0A109UGM9_9FIRM|nr:HAD family hydrolase [Erysipelothrix larvae]AMC92911.1 hypothetical protein AOC36_02595 [Erysipelothrix larvae]
MTRIAFIYDFDRTLSPKDMQEFGFIDQLNSNPETFWELSHSLSKKHAMDPILSYMLLMKQEMEKMGKHITKQGLKDLGKDIEYFPGVKDWFSRMNSMALSLGLVAEHYIISSGLKELIEGTEIFHEFKEVFACEYTYDDKGYAIWPAQSINYTTKTQFIFRINKGAMDVSDIIELNQFVPYNERPIPFEHMIYIGDGITDIPSMKVVKVNGGHSIAVFQKGHKEKVEQLVRDKRVNFCAPTDYTKGSHIEKICELILQEISVNVNQKRLRDKIEFIL